VNGTQVKQSASAIVDTGTTLIIGDTDGINALFAEIPGSRQVENGAYTSLLCSSLLSVESLTLFQFPVTLTPRFQSDLVERTSLWTQRLLTLGTTTQVLQTVSLVQHQTIPLAAVSLPAQTLHMC
jgi:hypothetical protein